MRSCSQARVIAAVLLLFLACVLLYVGFPGSLTAQVTTYESYDPGIADMGLEDMSVEEMPQIIRFATTRPIKVNKSHNKMIQPTKRRMNQTQENIQRRRKLLLERGCDLYANRLTHMNVALNPPRNVIVDDKNQLLYCFIPKIACTSWKMVFLQLNGFLQPGQTLSQYFVNRPGIHKLRLLQEYKVPQRRFILGHYKKFMFTRNPYSRVLSVFKNKLEPDSTFDRAKKWQNTVGKVILSKFADKTSSKKAAFSSLTFPKFINYLLDSSSPDNRHWKSIHESCYPCDVNYDVIGRFETLERDANYILSLIGDVNVSFPRAEQSSPTNSSNLTVLKDYYSQVPLKDMKKLYAKYKYDFQLFGYKEMKMTHTIR